MNERIKNMTEKERRSVEKALRKEQSRDSYLAELYGPQLSTDPVQREKLLNYLLLLINPGSMSMIDIRRNMARNLTETEYNQVEQAWQNYLNGSDEKLRPLKGTRSVTSVPKPQGPKVHGSDLFLDPDLLKPEGSDILSPEDICEFSEAVRRLDMEPVMVM